jgi:putative colanic acid biosynthesis acetyltransferase WcaF
MLDIQSNRAAAKYTLRENVLRMIWSTVSVFFLCSFRTSFGWRVMLLRLFGAKIGKDVRIHRTVVIEMPWNLKIGDYVGVGRNVQLYNLGHLIIGDRATISHGAQICCGTHDYQRASLPLEKKRVEIQADSWIGVNALVGPDVIIGQGAVVGMGSVVVKNVESMCVVGGNPARLIKKRIMRYD